MCVEGGGLRSPPGAAFLSPSETLPEKPRDRGLSPTLQPCPQGPFTPARPPAAVPLQDAWGGGSQPGVQTRHFPLSVSPECC